MTENSSIVSHISIGVNDFHRSLKFYDKVLAVMGARRVADYPAAVAYGKQFPEFWVQNPLDEKPATNANGFHIGFLAESKEQVEEFYKVALEAGATDDGAPGPRPLYGDSYFGCFVRDPDGHKIEAAYHTA